MNKEEIMRLGVGRDIDILIAEEIMGWQLEKDGAKLSRLNSYFQRDEERKWWRKPEGGWHCDPPSYSSDLAAAWQVVEMMNSRALALFLLRSSEESKVAFDQPRTISPDYISEQSITEAICKAALIAAVQPVSAASGDYSSLVSSGRH